MTFQQAGVLMNDLDRNVRKEIYDAIAKRRKKDYRKTR